MALSITALYHYAECHNVECDYTECPYGECRNAECCGADHRLEFFLLLNILGYKNFLIFLKTFHNDRRLEISFSIRFKGCHDIQHNDIQHNDTQHKGLICETRHK